MPAPPKYPTPHAQMLQLAREAREEGLTFEEFWDRAMRPGRPPATVAWLEITHPSWPPPEGAVLWPRDTTDRNQFIAAARWASDTWRACYLGRPVARSVAALRILAPLLSGEAPDEEAVRAFVSREALPSAA